MKPRRRLFTAVALSLIVGIAGGLFGGSSPAHAVVSIASSGTNTVLYSGTVHGLPENVFLAGLVQINFVVVRDPDFGTPPSVRLDIDVSNVFGVGLSTGKVYVSSGGQNLIRPLVGATDVVEITFPFFPSGPGGEAQARTAVATFTVNYNVTNGTLLSAIVSAIVDFLH